MKPKMNLRTSDDGYTLIERAASILAAHNMPQLARNIHQRASVRGYNFNHVLKLLKEYMTI